MRTPLSSWSDVGGVGVGVGIMISIVRIGGITSRLTIVGGLGWGNLRVVFEIRGVILLAIGGECAAFLAILHAIGLNKALHKKKVRSNKQNWKKKQSDKRGGW